MSGSVCRYGRFITEPHTLDHVLRHLATEFLREDFCNRRQRIIVVGQFDHTLRERLTVETVEGFENTIKRIDCIDVLICLNRDAVDLAPMLNRGMRILAQIPKVGQQTPSIPEMAFQPFEKFRPRLNFLVHNSALPLGHNAR